LVFRDLKGTKLYFASDFHLGAPDEKTSLIREKNIVRWLEFIAQDAQAIYLVGDLFDFWFEYKYTVPKGFVRLLGKLADLKDRGIEIHLFTGNHDMWMFDYFEKEIGVTIHRKPIQIERNGIKLYIGHGDGLGPGDYGYKFIKKVFASNISQWLFARVHPNFGFTLANFWSHRSRKMNGHSDEIFLGDDKEWLAIYANEILKTQHIDYFVFGHRHLPLEIALSDKSTYINLGAWFKDCTYACFDGSKMELLRW
jgi:UDP-2,3-diacylglucosamine hydrolase